MVNLADPESIALARKVLDMLSDDWPSVDTASKPAPTHPKRSSDSRSESGRRSTNGAQSLPPEDEADPWADTAPSPDKPSETRSAPSSGKQSDASASDDDVPWEV